MGRKSIYVYSDREIAQSLDIREDEVSLIFKRALRKIKKELVLRGIGIEDLG